MRAIDDEDDESAEPDDEKGPAGPFDGSSRLFINRARESPDAPEWFDLDQRYRQSLMRRADAILGPQLKKYHTVEDLVQEAWGRAYASLGDFEYQGPGSLFNWLCLLMRRIAAEWGRGREGKLGQKMGGATPSAIGTLEDERPGPKTNAFKADDVDQLCASLNNPSLPRLYREVLTALYIDKRPSAEVARSRGVSLDTLRRQKNRGIQILRGFNVDDNP
ncbi:MAG: sigma-70 family RNA polymerase sigma factor [Planctomycetes bacterium]|nr:sigma-70 family RNA polymerase sigma factor [Planctomycetota bacterium]